MTEAQTAALQNPLARAFGAIRPELKRIFRYKNQMVSVILSVNK
jgi:hypothetical protein